MLQICCKKYCHEFCRISWRKIKFTDLFQITCFHPCFFTDFARRTLLVWLIPITRPCRELEHILSCGMSVLTDEKNITFIINGDDHYGSAMFYNLQPGFLTVWCLKIVTPDLESAPL